MTGLEPAAIVCAACAVVVVVCVTIVWSAIRRAAIERQCGELLDACRSALEAMDSLAAAHDEAVDREEIKLGLLRVQKHAEELVLGVAGIRSGVIRATTPELQAILELVRRLEKELDDPMAKLDQWENTPAIRGYLSPSVFAVDRCLRALPKGKKTADVYVATRAFQRAYDDQLTNADRGFELQPRAVDASLERLEAVVLEHDRRRVISAHPPRLKGP